MPVILVELPASDSSDPNVPALIRACTEGLHAGKCTLEEGAETPAAVAIVSWLDEGHQRARLEVVSRTEHAAWHSRELSFREQDAAVERWRALGFAIAGLVGEASPQAAPSRTAAARARPSAAEPPTHTRPAHAWHTTLGAQLGRGLDAASSAGVWLGLGRRIVGPLEVLAGAAESWNTSESHGVSARFTTVGLGLGLALEPVQNFAVEGSAWAILDTLHVKAVDLNGGAEASAHRSLLGSALRLDAIWPADSELAGSLGGELLNLTGATGVRLFSQETSESPALRWNLRAGLRFHF